MTDDVEKGCRPFTAYVDHTFASMPHATASSNVRQRTETSSSSVAQLDEAFSTADVKRIKQSLRAGRWAVDDDVRRTLWWRICCQSHRDVDRGVSIFQELAGQVFGRGDNTRDATLPVFVDITCMHRYHLSDAGIKVARRVMCVIELECPDITYSPLLFTLACLLLHYMGEEDCYNSLIGLLKSKTRFISQTKLAYDAGKFVLKDLMKKHAKTCYQHLGKRGVVVEEAISHWIWWIFKDLPYSYTVGITDCYLFEGPKVLYRVALAILQLYYKFVARVGETKHDQQVACDISQFCEEINQFISLDKLLKMAFGIRGLSRKDLDKLQLKREMCVQSVMNASCLITSPSVGSLSTRVLRSLSVTVNLSSSTLNADQWSLVYSWLHPRWALLQPKRLFSTSEDGTSLVTFFNKVDGHEPTLIVIRTMGNEVFGAFCSYDWAERKLHDRNLSYFGNGESFVFTLLPRAAKYDWVGKKCSSVPPSEAELFQSADTTAIQIGGGGGVAISLDSALNRGRSEHCSTFDNPPLAVNSDFECGTLEVYTFT